MMKKLALILMSAAFLSACGEKTEVASDSGNAKPYPLKTCMVADEELGSMGEPVTLIHEGQEIKFCCGGCVDDFKENPAEYLPKLTQK